MTGGVGSTGGVGRTGGVGSTGGTGSTGGGSLVAGGGGGVAEPGATLNTEIALAELDGTYAFLPSGLSVSLRGPFRPLTVTGHLASASPPLTSRVHDAMPLSWVRRPVVASRANTAMARESKPATYR